MTGVFISYRQADAKAWAVVLRNELSRVFGPERVFLDKDSLHAGNWREQIRAALDRCRALIVVIGPAWLSPVRAGGPTRLCDPDDVHRQEIEMALRHAGLMVIPVLVDGAAPPRDEDLPEPLRPLASLQARRLADSAAHRQVDLALIVADLVSAGLEPLPASIPVPVLDRLARLAGRLAFAFAASLMLLALLELGLGWNLTAKERALIVLFVLVVTLAVSAARGRRRRGPRAAA